ncbi:MAG: hypothetical protein GC178_00685 [Flavobacteriales bacterium]|nr:hypothetical protein [Flavobacteriales bacterium]
MTSKAFRSMQTAVPAASELMMNAFCESSEMQNDLHLPWSRTTVPM